MNHKPIRTYTASDVMEIVEMLRDTHDISDGMFSDMASITDVQKHIETMTDEDIEVEVTALFAQGHD